MKKNRTVCFLLFFLTVAFTFVGCTGKESAPPAGKTVGTPLFEMFTSEDMSDFVENFDPENVEYVEYYRDEYDTVETEDKELILELFEGLRAITVTGKYEGDEYATDSASSVTFIFKDGTRRGVGFDFGNVYIDGELYEYTDSSLLSDAIGAMVSSAEGRKLFDMYTDEAIQSFAENFDEREVHLLIYLYNDEEVFSTSETEDIREIFELIASSEIIGKDRERDTEEAPAECFSFVLNSGGIIEIPFDFDTYLDAYIDGSWYTCQYNSSLHDKLEILRNGEPDVDETDPDEEAEDDAEWKALREQELLSYCEFYDDSNGNSAPDELLGLLYAHELLDGSVPMLCETLQEEWDTVSVTLRHDGGTPIPITDTSSKIDLLEYLLDTKVILYQNTKKDIGDTCDLLCLTLKDGTNVELCFEWDSSLKVELNGAWYTCQYNSSLCGWFELMPYAYGAKE